jgi:cytidylate kinase
MRWGPKQPDLGEEALTMPVITISRQLGSEGAEIARQVAASLNCEFVDKQTTDAIFRQYGLTRFDELYNAVPSLLDVLNANNLLLVAMANEIIQAVAHRGNVVILGRAGFAVLAGLADVLNVRIEAPVADRVQRVMEREGLADPDAAGEQVTQDDEVHGKYIHRFYNKQWDDPANFDLVLDTGALSMDEAVQQIVAAARNLDQKVQPADAPSTRSLQIDPVLADAVAKAIANPLPEVPT